MWLTRAAALSLLALSVNAQSNSTGNSTTKGLGNSTAPVSNVLFEQ